MTIFGILPALVTPFREDDTIDHGVLRRLVRHHLGKGCHGFYLCGSTGEGLLLSRDERRSVVETVLEEVAGAVPVVVHVGTLSTAEAVRLAEDAKRAGAAAVASLPPLYYRVGPKGIEEHLKAIAVGSELPTYYYHIPELTGVFENPEEFIETLGRVPGVVGVKFTSSDLYLMWAALETSGGRLSVLNGRDQMLVQALVTGARGGVGSTYNYQIETIVGLYEAFCAGDLEGAKRLQWRANRVIRLLIRHGGNLAAEKAILRLMGFEVGRPRGPLTPYPEERMEVLRRDLEEIGLLRETNRAAPQPASA